VHDRTSAEAYCTTHGRVLSPRTIRALAEGHDLSAWASVGGSTSPTIKSNTEETRALLKMLLELYMTAGCVLSDCLFSWVLSTARIQG
jgi:hypothetical protein